MVGLKPPWLGYLYSARLAAAFQGLAVPGMAPVQLPVVWQDEAL